MLATRADPTHQHYLTFGTVDQGKGFTRSTDYFVVKPAKQFECCVKFLDPAPRLIGNESSHTAYLE